MGPSSPIIAHADTHADAAQDIRQHPTVTKPAPGSCCCCCTAGSWLSNPANALTAIMGVRVRNRSVIHSWRRHLYEVWEMINSGVCRPYLKMASPSFRARLSPAADHHYSRRHPCNGAAV